LLTVNYTKADFVDIPFALFKNLTEWETDHV